MEREGFGSALAASLPFGWADRTESRLARHPDLRAFLESGCRRALNRFISANVGLARYYAQAFLATHKGRPFTDDDREEIHAAALRGLWRAAEVYDPSRGAFSRAAYWWTRDEMSRTNYRGPMALATRSEGRLTDPDGEAEEGFASYAAPDTSDGAAFARDRFEAAAEAAKLSADERTYFAALASGLEPARASELAEVPRKRAREATARFRAAWDAYE